MLAYGIGFGKNQSVREVGATSSAWLRPVERRCREERHVTVVCRRFVFQAYAGLNSGFQIFRKVFELTDPLQLPSMCRMFMSF